MLLNRFPLRSTSGGSQRSSSIGPGQSLAPPQAGIRPRARSLLGSDAGLSTHSAPNAHRQPTSSVSRLQVARRQVPNHEQNSLTAASVTLTAPSPPPGSPSGSSDLDAPISAGVRCRRDSSLEAVQLTPRHAKRLKTYAKQFSSERGIPLKKLVAFIDVRSTLLC